MSRKLTSTKISGISLIEALVAIFILMLAVISLTHLLTQSAMYTREDFLGTCLTQGAISGIEAVRGNSSLIGRTISYRCDLCNPEKNVCSNVTIFVEIRRIRDLGNCTLVEAEARTSSTSKRFSIRDTVCYGWS